MHLRASKGYRTTGKATAGFEVGKGQHLFSLPRCCSSAITLNNFTSFSLCHPHSPIQLGPWYSKVSLGKTYQLLTYLSTQ